jgi:hypothetical protein
VVDLALAQLPTSASD